MYKKHYSEFLNAHEGKLHMAAHSHHFWPDVARQGHMESYELSMKESDMKWDYIFSTLVPDVQKLISKILNFSLPENIAFAPNTHELITKLISSKMDQSLVRILTTKNEFHSLGRQLKRLQEHQQFEIITLDNEAESFEQDLKQILTIENFDFIIFSQVFFNSGLVLDETILKMIIELKKDADFVLDAYHGFCALPFDISIYENDMFYIAGSYKYAQSGEGMCFMTVPEACQLRPLFTGWFASFSTLDAGPNKEVEYDNNGMRFWGSTLDFTPFFRFRSVWNHFFKNNISIEELTKYTNSLQAQFLNNNPLKNLCINSDPAQIGRFVTFEFSRIEECAQFHEKLLAKKVLTDFRGKRLRFGFSPYINQQDIESLKFLLKSLI